MSSPMTYSPLAESCHLPSCYTLTPWRCGSESGESRWLPAMRRALSWLLAALALAMAAAASAQSGEVAMVTLLQGSVTRSSSLGKQPVEPFTKLRHGDLLVLDRQAKVQIVYFESGRQETWLGGGRLEITKAESTAFGLPPAEVKVLPAVMVRQIVKTPTLDSQSRGGMMRLRSVATAADVEKIEENYRRMRLDAGGKDINPDLYLLSSMFEIRELERVEQALADLQQRQRGNPDIGSVVALYNQALRNARDGKSR